MKTCRNSPLVAVAVAAVVAVAPSGCAQKSDDSDSNIESTDKAPASATHEDKPIDISSAKAAPDTWMEFGVDEHGFKTRFPVAPKKEDMPVPTPAGTMPGAMWLAEHGKEAVGVTVLTVPESMLADFNVEAALDGGRDGMINNVGGTIVSEKQADFAGQKARAIVAKVPIPEGDFDLEARLLWKSPRLYQLIALVPSGSNSPSVQKFFDSFELTSG
ncbi:MAG: hypothetical protein R6X02_15185 [Enhygromyxa sp.]